MSRRIALHAYFATGVNRSCKFQLSTAKRPIAMKPKPFLTKGPVKYQGPIRSKPGVRPEPRQPGKVKINEVSPPIIKNQPKEDKKGEDIIIASPPHAAPGGHYELSGLMTRMVESELQNIMIKAWQVLPDNPSDRIDSFVVEKFRNKAGDDLRNVIGLNTTKRLLNIHNPLNVKVQFSGKPGKADLREFLKAYNFNGFKRIESAVNMFAAQVRTITDFDRICTTKDIRCGNAKVTVTPIYKFSKCPPNLITHFAEEEDDNTDEKNKDLDMQHNSGTATRPASLENTENIEKSKQKLNTGNENKAVIPLNKTAEKKTTAAPSNSTDTTNKPIDTQNKPMATPNKPTDTSNKPMVTPNKPMVTPNKPTVTPNKPTVTPNKPTVTPNQPIVTTNKSTVNKGEIKTTCKTADTENKTAVLLNKTADTEKTTTAAPTNTTGTPNKPTGTPNKPTTTANKPTVTPNKPTGTPDKPTITPNKPTVPPNKPTVTENKTSVSKTATQNKATDSQTTPNKTTAPTNIATQSANKPAITANKTTIPANKSAVPAANTTVPTNKPVGPTNKTTVTPNKIVAIPKKTTAPTNKPKTNEEMEVVETKSKPAATKATNIKNPGKINPIKKTPTKKEVAKKVLVTPTKPKNVKKSAKVENDFDELDDHDILALMSSGIVLDECSGSDDD